METNLGIGLAAGILASVTVTSVPVQASSIMDEVTELETTEDHAEDTEYSRLRGNHLNYGNVKVQKLSSNEIAISGITAVPSCLRYSLSVSLSGEKGGRELWDL